MAAACKIIAVPYFAWGCASVFESPLSQFASRVPIEPANPTK